MLRSLSLALLTVALVVVAGCGNAALTTSRVGKAPAQLTVTSPAFNNGQEIPLNYTAFGGNVSPALSWTAGPAGTVNYIVIVEDRDTGAKPAVHWFVHDLPADRTSLPEGASGKQGIVEGKNYTGAPGYAGANPPPGQEHHYVFQVLALDGPAKIGADVDPHDLPRILHDQGANVAAAGTLTGTFQR